MTLASEMIQLLPRMLAYARGLGCREMDAADLVKDVMLRAQTSDGRIAHRRVVEGDILAEIRKSYIARYVLRNAARQPAHADDYVAYSQMAHREMLKLQDALQAIDPALAECFALKTGNDMSPTEIAHALKLPVATVRSRLARARQEVARLSGCTVKTAPRPLRAMPIDAPEMPKPAAPGTPPTASLLPAGGATALAEDAVRILPRQS